MLIVSLLGSAITCAIFGTSTSLQQAICVRLLQGIFAGAVGVARGSIAFVTDATNEGRAYAILGYVTRAFQLDTLVKHLTDFAGVLVVWLVLLSVEHVRYYFALSSVSG